MYLEHAIQVFTNQPTTTDLKTQYDLLRKGKSSEERKAVEVLYSVFQANLLTSTVDDINEKSTLLYEQANSKALLTNNIALQVWVQTQTGYYFYRFFRYNDALLYFLKSSHVIDTSPNSVSLDKGNVLQKNAYFFFSMLESKKAMTYLKMALEAPQTNPKNYASLLNAIGQCYLDMQNMKTALYYFNETKDYAIKSNDSIRYAKALGDIGRVYMQQKKWDEAEVLLKKDIEISDHLGEGRNSMFAQMQLGSLYTDKGNNKAARAVFLKAKQYAASKSYLKNYDLEIANLLLPIALDNRDDRWELQLRREIDSLNNQISKNKLGISLDIIHVTLDKEKAILQLQKNRIEGEKQTLIKYALISVAILLIVLCILIRLLYKRRLRLQQADYENKFLSYKLDKSDSEFKLKQTNISLASFKTYLLEKNEQIDILQKEINSLTFKSSIKSSIQKQNLEELLNSHIMTAESWETFKKTFSISAPAFYTKVLSNQPAISESNLRIILLNRIGLNNAEIAKVLGITLDGVKKSKQRMRKKYGEIIEEYL